MQGVDGGLSGDTRRPVRWGRQGALQHTCKEWMGPVKRFMQASMMGEMRRSPTKPTLWYYLDMYKLFPHW